MSNIAKASLRSANCSSVKSSCFDDDFLDFDMIDGYRCVCVDDGEGTRGWEGEQGASKCRAQG